MGWGQELWKRIWSQAIEKLRFIMNQMSKFKKYMQMTPGSVDDCNEEGQVTTDPKH